MKLFLIATVIALLIFSAEWIYTTIIRKINNKVILFFKRKRRG